MKGDIGITNFLYAYTKHKEIARDYKKVHGNDYSMYRIDSSDLPKNYNRTKSMHKINYFELVGEESKRYKVPMTCEELYTVYEICEDITSRISFINYEVCSENQFGLRKKYLNVIMNLTSILNMNKFIDYVHVDNNGKEVSDGTVEFYQSAILFYDKINSLKIYYDTIIKNE